MRNVVLVVRWLALAAVLFFVIALVTGKAGRPATATLVAAVVVVAVVSVVDLVVRRRR